MRYGYTTYVNTRLWISYKAIAELVMAIQPSDLGEDFVRSGKRLITQRSADELLLRVNTFTKTPAMSEKREEVRE